MVEPALFAPTAAASSTSMGPSVEFPASPSLLAVRPQIEGGVVAALVDSAVATQALPVKMITVVDASSGSLGEDGVTPVMVFPNSVGGSADGTVAGGVVSPQAAGIAGPGWSSSALDPGIGGSGTDWGSSSGLDGPDGLPPGAVPPAWSDASGIGVPDVRHVEVEGALDPSSDGFTVQIPVGPTTHELGLSVRPGDGTNPGQGPVLGQMSLVDRNGDVLARLSPEQDQPGDGPADAVTLSLQDVPVGGTLIVQISSPSGGVSSPSATSTSTTTTNAVGGALPFVMDVQRLESDASTATAGMNEAGSSIASSMGRLMIGTLAGDAEPQGLASTSSEESSSSEVAGPSTVVVDESGEIATSGDVSTSSDSSPAEFNARIATGPLAARAAAPIGPNLSSVATDPAPAIDRHERALSQEIAAIDADDVSTARDPSSRAWDSDPASPRSGEAGEWADPEKTGLAVVSVAGLGPLRLRTSATRAGDRRGELGALFAAFGPSDRSEEKLAVLAGDEPVDDPVLVALAAPATSNSDRRPTPDYLTTACFLALGMGLMTRPIIPDLLRLIPSRSSRWRSAGGLGAGLRPGHPSRNAGFGDWRRRRLDSPVCPS